MYAEARGFDVMIVAMIVFAAAIGASTLLNRPHRHRVPAWVYDAALAACAVAYVAIGALPMLRHLPFLYGTFPLTAALGLAAIAAGFVVLLLSFVL